MNQRRLLQLADWIEELPPYERESQHRSTWVDVSAMEGGRYGDQGFAGEGMKLAFEMVEWSRLVYNKNAPNKHHTFCGCIAGHCIALFGPDEAPNWTGEDPHQGSNWSIPHYAAEILELNHHQRVALFEPEDLYVDPIEAARAIRNLASGMEPNLIWREES